MSSNTNTSTSSSPSSIISVSPPTSQSPNLLANYLPCSISYNGPTNATKLWHPRPFDPEVDGSKLEDNSITVSYFRGRKLLGRRIELPKGYVGVVVSEPQERIKTKESSASRGFLTDRCAGEEKREEEEEEQGDDEVREMETLGVFDGITVWGHDEVVEKSEDGLSRGVSEWIEFSKKIHDHSGE